MSFAFCIKADFAQSVSFVTSPTVTGTITSFVATLTETATVTASPPARVRRSDGVELEARAVAVPTYLAKFASSAVSQACSCLSIPVSTVKSTTTATSTTMLSITESVTSTVPTGLSRVETTYVPSAVVVTATTTTTVTETVTPTPPAPPKSCNVFGRTYSIPGTLLEDYENSSPYACHQKCLANAECKSIFINSRGGCALWKLPVSRIAFPDPSVEGVQAFYDRACEVSEGTRV